MHIFTIICKLTRISFYFCWYTVWFFIKSFRNLCVCISYYVFCHNSSTDKASATGDKSQRNIIQSINDGNVHKCEKKKKEKNSTRMQMESYQLNCVEQLSLVGQIVTNCKSCVHNSSTTTTTTIENISVRMNQNR